jgi:hypothetical protein
LGVDIPISQAEAFGSILIDQEPASELGLGAQKKFGSKSAMLDSSNLIEHSA